MNPYLLALLIGLAAGAVPSWWLTADHYQGVIAKEHEAMQRNVIEQQEKNRLALLAYADRIVKAGAEHDQNIRTIRNLGRDLDRVRVVFPTCPMPRTAESGADSDEAGRLLSNGVDAAFADLQSAAGRLVEEADELNAAAIRANVVR